MRTGKQRFVTKEQASFTELIDHQESILLDLESLHYYSLNAAATLLWKHLRAGRATTLAELSHQLSAAFGLSAAAAARDTQQFVDELFQHQLLAYTAEPPHRKTSFVFPTPDELPDYEPPVVKTANAVMEMNLAGTSSMGGSGALSGTGS